MSGQQAATALGVELRTLYRWERGQFEPNFEVLARLCALYSVTPTWLIMGHVAKRQLKDCA